MCRGNLVIYIENIHEMFCNLQVLSFFCSSTIMLIIALEASLLMQTSLLNSLICASIPLDYLTDVVSAQTK